MKLKTLFLKYRYYLLYFDYWIFDKRVDPIITALPEEYFLTCGVMYSLLIIVISLILKLTYIKDKRKTLNL